MEADAGRVLCALNVDGGASRNDFLAQFQADVLGMRVRRPQNIETTSLGAAYLAGLTSGFWSGTDELRGLRGDDDCFEPRMGRPEAERLLAGWARAVGRAM